MSEDSTKRNKFLRPSNIILLCIILALPIYIGYNIWSQSQMNEILISTIDDRNISNMTFRVNTEEGIDEFSVGDDSIDDLITNLEGVATNVDTGGVYVPSYIVWQVSITRRPFEEISEPPNIVVLDFENGESETIYFTFTEMEIGQTYYTMNQNPFSLMVEDQISEQ